MSVLRIGLKAVAAGAAVVAFATAPAAFAQSTKSDRVTVAIGHKAGAQGAARTAVQRAGGRVVHDLSEASAFTAELPRSALAALARHPQIDFVEQGVLRRPLGKRGPLALPGTAQSVPYGIPMVQADQVSDAQAGNRTLCIVDSGVDASHEDLQGVPMTGQNFTSSGDWNTDENSHGTHVAGTIAAVGNTVGVVGVAPSATLRLHIAKVFDATGSASSITIARAMYGCWRGGANVVSMSLGGSSASRIEQRIAALLASRGVLTIAAAGNAGDTSVSYPAGFAEVVSVAAVDSGAARASFSQFNADVEIAAPGVAVLSTVPALSQTGATANVGASPYTVQAMDGSPRTSASAPLANFGLGLTATPGSMTGQVCLIQRGDISFADKVTNCQASGGVGAIIYNNVAGELFGTLGTTATAIPSVGATQADGATMLGQLGQQAAVAVFGLPDVYAAYNGTSMATPHVSGVAAVVWSLHPGCSAEQIRASLNLSATDLGAVGRDAQFGFGLVQAKAAHDRITSLGCGN